MDDIQYYALRAGVAWQAGDMIGLRYDDDDAPVLVLARDGTVTALDGSMYRHVFLAHLRGDVKMVGVSPRVRAAAQEGFAASVAVGPPDQRGPRGLIPRLRDHVA